MNGSREVSFLRNSRVDGRDKPHRRSHKEKAVIWSDVFLGGSRSFLDLESSWSVRANPLGGQIAVMRAAARMIMARQIGAGRSSPGSGGNGAQIGLGVFKEQCEQQMGVEPGVEPGLGEPVVLGGQAVDMQDRLQSLEREFDLPA